jgi:hypothetical protein
VEQQLKELHPQQATHETTVPDMEEAVTPAPDQTPRQEVLPLA